MRKFLYPPIEGSEMLPFADKFWKFVQQSDKESEKLYCHCDANKTIIDINLNLLFSVN